jgi:hypothetical protein
VIRVNRAPVLTLWAAVVAERLGHPSDTALTMGRAVADAGARKKARRIGIIDERHLEEEKRQHDLRPEIKPVRLLGINVRMAATADGELRADDGRKPADPAAVERYLAKAFGDRLQEVKAAMEELAGRLDPAELNRIGFRIYERFRPEVPDGAEGWGAKSALEIEKIRAAG